MSRRWLKRGGSAVISCDRRKEDQQLPAANKMCQTSTGAIPEEVITMTTSPSRGERLTVTLIPKAEADLRRLQERTNLSRTDLANRAITLYEFFDAQTRAGHDMIARDNETGMTKLVQLHDAPERQAVAAGPAFHRRGPVAPGRRPGRHRRQIPSPGGPRRGLPLAGLAGQEVRTR
jgi:hypothetical protein